MPKHPDFEKVYSRFVKQYGPVKGKELYSAWLNKKGYDDTKHLPKGKEKKEMMCRIKGVEVKEIGDTYHVEGLIATTHIDNLDHEEGIEIPDMSPKVTLESWAIQINTTKDARVMGVHHSEGRPFNPEYFGVADIETTPAKVMPLPDGEWGLYVDTILLKDDPQTPEIIERFESGDLNSFSITYDTDGFMTTDFGWVGDDLVRILGPETKLFGYTAANNPVNPNAVAVGYGFKEFKELVGKIKNKEGLKMVKEKKEEKGTPEGSEEGSEAGKPEDGKPAEGSESQPEAGKPEEKVEEPEGEPEGAKEKEEKEFKEFKKFQANKRALEKKEALNAHAAEVAKQVLGGLQVKEKVLKIGEAKKTGKELPLEIKEFREVISNPETLELKEQFRRGAAVCDAIHLDWQTATTSSAESREYKDFGVKGRHLEFKGLGVTTNQNTDTDYLQSSAELQDVYDPMIYNGLNQETVTWNVLAKDDYSKKGNNQIQFTLKTAANTSATFYTGNAVSTGNVTRLKYQTKFKKLQVGVSVDGDMIAAARGGPISDVFAQEVMDSTMDMLAVLNAALFAEVGLETASAVIGFEYITDSAGNTSLYNLTRSTTNLLSPDSAGDTYINQASADISMTNLRAAKRQAIKEGAKKTSLVYVTNPVQADMYRNMMDDSRRLLSAKDTNFGFSTDLFMDGIPIFEDKDCNTDDWFLVDLETHRVGIWIPPTIEKLGKNADSEDAFIKTYLGTYNRAPRRMVQIYGCATS